MKKKKIAIHFYLTLWVVLTISFSAAVGLQIHKYTVLLNEEAKYTKLIEDEQKKAESLVKDKDYYESDAYVEKIAREQLGFIHSDETLFFNDSKKY